MFATGLYRDRLEPVAGRLKVRDTLILFDTFAVPTLLATPQCLRCKLVLDGQIVLQKLAEWIGGAIFTPPRTDF